MADQFVRHTQDEDDDDELPIKPLDVDFNRNGDEGSTGGKAARLPRWTRQEILVLIQGKRVAENRVRRGRTAALCDPGSGSGSGQQAEPKWVMVSSYCKRHGVNRGPVQCRKRWSNLAGDFKKIKEWDSQIKDEGESFWLMRNDVRRDRKLPGFFDREVFDILNSGETAVAHVAQVRDAAAAAATTVVAEPEPEPVFDSGRSAGADDGLFSDCEPVAQQLQQEQQQGEEGEIDKSHDDVHVTTPAPPLVSPVPISEKQYQPMNAEDTSPGMNQEKQGAAFQHEIGSTSGEARKRRRVVVEEEGEGRDELIQILERNGRLLSSQLDAYNINLKLDREERKDHATSLVGVLNKLADALGRIADKL